MAYLEFGPRGFNMYSASFTQDFDYPVLSETYIKARSIDLDVSEYFGQFAFNQSGDVAGYISSFRFTMADGVLVYQVSGVYIPASVYWNYAYWDDVEGLYRYGLSYDDTIIGGSGRDIIFGHTGDDLMLGNDGDDGVYGDAGNDDLNGNRGRDTVYGDTGNDYVRGGQDDDLVGGGDGDDWHVNGNIGFDTVFGGAGHDQVYGGPDNDLIYGEAGNDTLSGDRHNDTLIGGADADVFVFRSDGGWDLITDFSRIQGDKIAVQAGINGTGIATPADLLARLSADPGGSALLDLGDGQKVGILGVGPATFTAADFWVI
ncbi:hypothetical protein STAQ_33790 [Allostella sp. ATCC 35155]|nr:hypothetical protein STAQ_33790 [Stella sp. ATCC 35155]